MNREIKFRAWNGRSMEFGGFSVHATNGMIIPGDITNVGEGAPLMQFTGLLDKHGNEIYEGDILGLNGIKQLWIVVFEDQAFRVKDADTGITQIGVLGECMSIMNEIIGNIYQSPELLEDK